MLSKILTFPWGRLLCMCATFISTMVALDGPSTRSIAAAIVAVGFIFAFVALYGIAVFRGIKARSE
jgi:hypothetical protein